MAWSRKEVDRTVSTYFEMFKRQLRGEDFVKADYHRDLATLLDDRSESAVALKFCNVSAILLEYGFPHIQGYSPQSHYQKLLKTRVGKHLEHDDELHDLLETEAANRPEEVYVPSSPEDILSSPPDEDNPDDTSEPASPRFGRQIDYVERERRNRDLGKAGEEYVVELEKNRLRLEGRKDLADRVASSQICCVKHSTCQAG